MDELEPIYRIEYFLDAWLNSTTPPEPIYRIEYYLAALAGADVVIPTPIYRIEFYLAKLCGEDVEIPEPIYRIEQYLAKMCEEDVDPPEPIYRVEFWLDALADGGGGTWTTFTGNPIEFDAPKAHALKSCVVDIEPVQAGTGDPSPENQRPINGWTEANVYRTEKNIWDEEWEVGGYYTATGLPWATNDRIRSKNYIPVVPNTIYYIIVPNGANTGVLFYDGDKNYIVGSNAAKYNTTFATPTNAAYMKFNTGSNYGATYHNDISINYPSTDHDYHAYQGSSLTLPFGQTVYGGNASYEGNGIWRITPFPEYDSYNGETLVGPWQSSIDKYVAGTSPTIGAQVVDKGGADPSFTITTAELFDALQGRNVMWTDCNNLTVEAKGTAVELNALQSLNLLLGNRYVNNHTEEDVSDEEALQIILGEQR